MRALEDTVTDTAVQNPTRTRALPMAAGGAVIHMLLLAPAYGQDDDFAIVMWVGMAALGTVLTWPVYARVVPGAGARTAAVLGALCALSVVFFWAAVTVPLAGAAALAAAAARRREDSPALSAVGVLGALAGLVGIAVIAVASAT